MPTHVCTYAYICLRRTVRRSTFRCALQTALRSVQQTYIHMYITRRDTGSVYTRHRGLTPGVCMTAATHPHNGYTESVAIHGTAHQLDKATPLVWPEHPSGITQSWCVGCGRFAGSQEPHPATKNTRTQDRYPAAAGEHRLLHTWIR